MVVWSYHVGIGSIVELFGGSLLASLALADPTVALIVGFGFDLATIAIQLRWAMDPVRHTRGNKHDEPASLRGLVEVLQTHLKLLEMEGYWNHNRNEVMGHQVQTLESTQNTIIIFRLITFYA